MTLAELHNDLRDFATGALSPSELTDKLQAEITDNMVELSLPGGPLDASVAEQLLARLIFHFEDLGKDLLERQQQARILVAALDTFAPGVVLELLPWLFTKERLVEVVEKYQAGVVSRTNLVAAVSSAQLPSTLQRWLYAASTGDLAQFAECVRKNDLRRLQRLTGLAAA